MAKSTRSIGEVRKKVTKTHELISTSYHEAGHTIYALLHIMIVSSVSVFEDKKMKRMHGLTCYDYPIEFDSIEDLELLNLLIRTEIGMRYSGLVAEKHHFKSMSGSDQIPLFITEGSSEDNKSAAQTINKYNVVPPGRKRYAYKQKLNREILAHLQEHWDAITVVAHGLFRHRKLTYNDLQELLTKKTHHKKFWKEQFKKISHIYQNKQDLDENELKIILKA